MAKCFNFHELPAHMAYVPPLLSDCILDGIPETSLHFSHHFLRLVCTECRVELDPNDGHTFFLQQWSINHHQFLAM